VVDSARISARLDGDVVVSGQPGAVPARSNVRIVNEGTDADAGTVADEDGAFVVSIAGHSGDTISVMVEANGETANVTLDVPAAPEAPVDDAGASRIAPRATEPRDVDWPNVDWSKSVHIDVSEAPLTGFGLWMGTGVEDPLDIEAIEPPYATTEGLVAWRFAGDSPALGGDIYFHLPLPVEGTFGGVYFMARSRAPSGQSMRVTLGGPQEKYWSDTNEGADWPVWELTLGEAWSKHELTFADLGFDAQHLSPYTDMFGALHFLIAAEQAYDFEVFDLVFVNFVPR
jgi:hypothetical protein